MTHITQGFYAFFLPAVIPNRRAAINAVIAGVIAGSMLTLVMGAAGVVWFLRDGGKSQTTGVLLAATVTLAIVTIGTWKRVLSAPIIGLFLGMLTVVWTLWHHQTATATLLAIPFVDGFWTAMRGILALRVLGRTNSSANSPPA